VSDVWYLDPDWSWEIASRSRVKGLVPVKEAKADKLPGMKDKFWILDRLEFEIDDERKVSERWTLKPNFR
jgi:hypothetical protein